MNRLLVSVLMGLLSGQASFAEEGLESGLLMELQQDMQRYSDLATDTRQNVDYMPYVISTLHYKDLVDLGVLNLRDAISLIPGVDLNVGMAGVKNPIFRGSNPYAFGQSRLIIDGMVVNDQIFGGYNQFLAMPVDIIHRIEVVRGPGSMLTHVNGYAGSIHVITKANRDDGQPPEDAAFALLGSDELSGAGIIKSFELAGGRFSTDLYYQQNDSHLPVGDDYIPVPPTSGEADQSLENYQIGLNYQLGGLVVKGRVSQNDSGVSYGQAFSISEDDSDYLDVANNAFEVNYTKQLSDRVGFELALDYLDENRELQNKVMPDGSMIMMPPTPLPDGRYFLVDYSEKSLSQRLQFNVDISVSHKLRLGVQATQAEIINNDAATSDDDLVSFTRFNLFTNEKRNINTFYVEDMIDIGDKTSAQLGAKLSQYNDVEDQSAVRLAVVHRYDDENIFKAMFSQAYREPSWREQYLNAPAFFKPNPVLATEQVDALELAYIRRLGHRDFVKLNTFLLQNNDQIDAQNTTKTFDNTDENDLYGFEVEYEAGLSAKGVLHINYSYVDGSNVSGELANTAQSLANIYYLHRASENWNYSGLVKYAGSKGRVLLDPRDDVAAYAVLDLSASYRDSSRSTMLSLSVKNAFDKSYYLPSPNGTYPDDFEQAGRTWLLRLSKEF